MSSKGLSQIKNLIALGLLRPENLVEEVRSGTLAMQAVPLLDAVACFTTRKKALGLLDEVGFDPYLPLADLRNMAGPRLNHLISSLSPQAPRKRPWAYWPYLPERAA